MNYMRFGQKLELTINIEPVAQGRPAFTAKHGFGKAYDPAKSKQYKQELLQLAMPFAPPKPLQGAIKLTATFYRSIPKSYSKKKRRACEDGVMLPTSKPDVDNYAKALKDALNGVFWVDDSQVVELHAYKKYGAGHIEITIEVIE